MRVNEGRYKVRIAHVSIALDGPKPQVCDAATAARLCASWLIHEDLDPDQEHMILIALDARGYATGIRTICTGTLTASLIHPREVFRAAILFGAASVILAHNHPSGDPEPSGEDLGVTARMVACGELMGIPLMDHVVFTRGGLYRSAQ